MEELIISEIENSIRIRVKNGFAIKYFINGETYYAEEIQIPDGIADEILANIEIVSIDNIPEENPEDSEEIDYEQAYYELTEVLDDE